jgi:DNA integrity scanning protein DisA with diadenylate cyclase activity
VCFTFSPSDGDVREVGVQLLAEFAKLDGATFISKAGRVVRTNTAVYPKASPDVKIFKDRGTRHKSAEMIARSDDEAVVIVISENGGISLLSEGCNRYVQV